MSGEAQVEMLNAYDLERELAWFTRVLDARFNSYFGTATDCPDVFDIAPPDLAESRSAYASFVRHYELSFGERAAVVLALVPHIRPHLLDVFHTKNKTFDRKYTEFGGVRDATDDFLPTGETLAFILCGTDLQLRFSLEALFQRDHFFARHDILRLLPAGRDQTLLKGALQVSQDYLGRLTTGQIRRPDLSPDFPARYIETQLSWSDIVLHPGALRQVQEIEVWLRHGNTLMDDWGMAPKLRPGYRALFYGPPGTGKTMTACLLGKSTGREVYKVVVNKLPETVLHCLRSNGHTLADLTWVLPHQMNMRIIEASAKRLELPLERFLTNIQDTGNTSSASVPILMDQKNRDGTLKKGDLVCIVVFGGGFTWGSMLVRW